VDILHLCEEKLRRTHRTGLHTIHALHTIVMTHSTTGPTATGEPGPHEIAKGIVLLVIVPLHCSVHAKPWIPWSRMVKANVQHVGLPKLKGQAQKSQV